MRTKNAMTLEELAKELRLSPKTLTKSFNRTSEHLKKYGIIITKWGWGKNAEYEIEYEELEEEE